MMQRILKFFVLVLLCGCTSESEDVTELPVFFTFNTLDDFELDGVDREYWLMISDQEGKEVGIKKFKKGDQVEFAPPAAHNDKDVYGLTFFKLYRDGQPQNSTKIIPYFYFETYTSMAPGEYLLTSKADSGVEPVIRGSHKLQVNNYPVQNPQFISVSGRNVRFATNLGTTLVSQPFFAGLFEPAGDIFYLTIPSPGATPKSYFVKDAQIEQTKLIDYQMMKTPTTLTYTVAGASKASGSLQALPAPGQYDLAFTISDNTMEFFQPATNSTKLYFDQDMNYPEYITEIGWSTGSGASFYRLVGNAPATGVKNPEFEVIALTKEGSNYQLRTSGQYDFSSVSASGAIGVPSDPDGYYLWQIHGPQGADQKIILPPVPIKIMSSPFAGRLQQVLFVFNRVELVEYPSLDGYDEFLQFKFNSTFHLDAKHKERLRKVKVF